MKINEVQGAIFDVDDTLLDNKPGVLGSGLHERSRLAAIRAVGRERSLPELTSITLKQNLDAFLDAPVHSSVGAIWNYLHRSGLVSVPEIDMSNELLQEIEARKVGLHADILRNEGEEVPGASDFVRTLGAIGLKDRLAIASSSVRSEVDMFLDKFDLMSYFHSGRVITAESVKHTKPDPEPYNLAFASLHLPEKYRPSVLAFEDDPRGIASAKTAGLFVCAITTRFSCEQLQNLVIAPDLIASSYDEFAGHLDLPQVYK